MKWPLFFLLFTFFHFSKAFPLSITSHDARKIGEKIWKNECGGTVEGLTTWNKGEEFASLGIGHFIWYPVGKEDRFEETFPLLVLFLKEQKASLPSWLEKTKKCPWNSREEFYNDLHSPRINSLKRALFDTRNLQAIFIANRLEQTFPQMIEKLPPTEQKKVISVFYRLAADPKGLYALIDYLNFKGAGISPIESYKGQGWGLLQVLQRVSPTSENPVADFVGAAKELLSQRVQNSPPERSEGQWLKGWFNRLNTYLEE